MTITYPEGGTPGLLLRQRGGRKPITMNTFRVQLVPSRPAPKTKIGGPEDVVALVKEMENFDRESAAIVHLDTKNQVVGIETISIGNLNTSIVHPRETLKGAILNSSANVIFVHNHPSGICGPSREDIEITERLKKAFDIMGITLLDSIIVGKECHYSLRESGYITGKTEQMTSWVAEPRTERETKDKVELITAVTDYINSGADLERRKRSGEKIQASRYFKPWFEEFFYEHDRENAKKKLMKLFGANEQGLGVVNYTYYGVISEYLRAISKPAAQTTAMEPAMEIAEPHRKSTGVKGMNPVVREEGKHPLSSTMPSEKELAKREGRILKYSDSQALRDEFFYKQKLLFVWKANCPDQVKGNLELVRVPILYDFVKEILPRTRKGYYSGKNVDEQYKDMFAKQPHVAISYIDTGDGFKVWKIEDIEDRLYDILSKSQLGWVIKVNKFEDGEIFRRMCD